MAAPEAQGGGTAAQAAASLASSLRITRNPGLTVQPMFVRPAPRATRANSGKQPAGAAAPLFSKL